MASGLIVAMLAATAALAAPAWARSTGSGRAITSLDPPTNAFQQPYLATDPANPERLAMAYRNGNTLNECYLATSTNGGSTWHTRALVGSAGGVSLPSGATHCDNPQLSYGPAGALYFVFQDTGFRRAEPTALNSFIMASSDSGAHFAAPVMLDPSAAANDWYPNVAVDPKSGRVYVAWSRYAIDFTVFPGYVLVESSTDRARSFSTPVRIDPPQAPQYIGAPFMTIGSDGRLYVAFLPGGAQVGKKIVATPDALQVAVSADSARTFTTAAVAPLVKDCVGARGRCADLVPSSVDESIAAGRSRGLVYLAWWDDRGPNGLPRVMLSSSKDGGHAWSGPRDLPVPVGAGGDQIYAPWISVAPNGHIDVAFYALTPTGDINIYRTSSSDGGLKFTAPVRLDAQPSPAKVGPSAGSRLTANFGEYPAVVSSDHSAVVAWTDSSRGDLTTGHQDVFVAAATLGGGGFPVWGYMLIALGVLAVVALVAAGLRRSGRRKQAAPAEAAP